MGETRTCALWREQQAQRQEMFEALDKLAAEEFPPGTRVRWTHTFERSSNAPLKREGVVDSLYGHSLFVTIKPGGPKHRVPAYLAEIVATPTKVQATA
ncbi:hypothetical protein [Ramlibacter sp. AN1133]|uniref:hypothetical protein n=1 Tax=Ramlibacter sp. AN1133 TaxID=3133429 RepID=UPI0030C43AC5